MGRDHALDPTATGTRRVGPGSSTTGKIQIDKLKNVEFIPDTKLDAKGVKEYGAEIVIVRGPAATGRPTALNGATHATIPRRRTRAWAHILTPEQIMVEGKQAPGERVIVFDKRRLLHGVSLAEKLALEGKKGGRS